MNLSFDPARCYSSTGRAIGAERQPGQGACVNCLEVRRLVLLTCKQLASDSDWRDGRAGPITSNLPAARLRAWRMPGDPHAWERDASVSAGEASLTWLLESSAWRCKRSLDRCIASEPARPQGRSPALSSSRNVFDVGERTGGWPPDGARRGEARALASDSTQSASARPLRCWGQAPKSAQEAPAPDFKNTLPGDCSSEAEILKFRDQVFGTFWVPTKKKHLAFPLSA